MRTRPLSPPLLLSVVLAAATAALGAMALAQSRTSLGDHPGPRPLRPDLNSAPERHLLLLPGVGPSRARAIAEDRALRGPFRAPRDLARVRGFGPVTVSALALLVEAEGPTGGAP